MNEQITQHSSEILSHVARLEPEISSGVLNARDRDFPIKLFYAEMRKARGSETWNEILDIGSSIDVDELEKPGVLRVIETSHQTSLADNHYTEYASSYGALRLRESIVGFFERWGQPGIDLHSEVMVTRGIIDSVARVMRAINIDHVVIPEWSPYFVRSQAIIQDLEVINASIDSSGNFNLSQLDNELHAKQTIRGRTLMYLCHPAAPLGTVMEDQFIEEELIPFLKKQGIWVISDSYIFSTSFDGRRLKPMVSYEGFTDIGIEAITVSKELGLPGARAGGIVGNKDLINAVRLLAASEVDIVSGVSQELAAEALNSLDSQLVSRRIAQELENEILPRFELMGWPVVIPKAGIDMVVEVSPRFRDSGVNDPALLASFSILRRFGVAISPCSVFGPNGNNYLRIVLKQKSGEIPKALDLMREQGFDWATDTPCQGDIDHLQSRIDNLDLTRL